LRIRILRKFNQKKEDSTFSEYSIFFFNLTWFLWVILAHCLALFFYTHLVRLCRHSRRPCQSCRMRGSGGWSLRCTGITLALFLLILKFKIKMRYMCAVLLIIIFLNIKC
jgi:hypothetical protein